MKNAELWREQSTCTRRKVGAVVTKGKYVLSSGYNGAPPGRLHCDEGGCPRGKLNFDECPPYTDYNDVPCTAVHAEVNAILRCGVPKSFGTTMYVTEEPCQQCWNVIKAANVGVVVTPTETYIVGSMD